MYVKIEEFNAFTNNHEMDDGSVRLKTDFLAFAEEVVQDRLGYDPEHQSRTLVTQGIGDWRLYLDSRNITEITSVYLDGMQADPQDFAFNDDAVYFNDRRVWPTSPDSVIISYKSGWNEDSMPAAIKVAVLNIASLKLQEAGGNIGITGKSIDANSRTFINYTSFDKWLKPLDKYRVVRFC